MLAVLLDDEPALEPEPIFRRLRTITVPAHSFVIEGRSIVRGSATCGALFMWTKKLVDACFVAAMIATGVLLFTHFTQKWTAAGYPMIPISALKLDGATNMAAPQAIPLHGRHYSQHQQVHTAAAKPASNFAQYEG